MAIAPRGGGAGAGAPPDPCPRPVARLDEAWGPSRQAAVRAHATRIDPRTGSQRFAAVAALFDRGTLRWSSMQVATCREARRAGPAGADDARARTRCLDKWLEGMTIAVNGLERATDPAELEGAATSRAASTPPSSRS